MTSKVKGDMPSSSMRKKVVKTRGKQSSTDPQGEQTLYDVLELTLIPKNHRIEGDRARVTWVESKTKKKTCHYVTIKKISGK